MFIMINETARANINNILERAIDIGQRMLVTGAEVSRVERTITFICRAYGVRQYYCDNSRERYWRHDTDAPRAGTKF